MHKMIGNWSNFHDEHYPGTHLRIQACLTERGTLGPSGLIIKGAIRSLWRVWSCN